MSRKPLAVTLAAVAATGIVAGCGGGTKKTQYHPPGLTAHPVAMHKWCNVYSDLLEASGWTDKQIYQQLKDAGSRQSRSTFKAQVRWCFTH